MKLLVDTREHKLHECLHCSFEITQLHVGDVCILGEEDKPLLYLERKTVDDLAASIKDGRFKEQLLRLQSSGAMIGYIIEGHKSYTDNGFVCGLPMKAINSTLFKLCFKYRIPCFHTANVGSTATLVASLYHRFETGKHEDWVTESTSIDEYNTTAIKTVKKENLTPELAFIQQLCSIPGISSSKAKQIISKLDCVNMFQLLQVLNNNPSATLQTVPGIGAKLSESILTYLGLRIPT